MPGLIPDDAFFTHLANRRFPVTVWLRKPEEFDYIVEPDVFHDFFGHVPLLFDRVYADHLHEYGKGGLKAMRLDAVKMLARLYWYTIEFGLMKTPAGDARLRRGPALLRRRARLLRGRSEAAAPALRPRAHHAHRVPDRPLPGDLLRHRLLRAADARDRARLHADLCEAAGNATEPAVKLRFAPTRSAACCGPPKLRRGRAKLFKQGSSGRAAEGGRGPLHRAQRCERQEAVGLQAVTDGEMRRDYWHLDFTTQLDGVTLKAPVGMTFNAEDVPPMATITGKLDCSKPIFVDHFRFLKSVTRRRRPSSPSRRRRRCISAAAATRSRARSTGPAGILGRRGAAYRKAIAQIARGRLHTTCSSTT